MSGNFVTEADLEEARKNRQAEWERVRKPDDPEEAPEETYDHRSLFERLEEHKRAKVYIICIATKIFKFLNQCFARLQFWISVSNHET